ncbi:MAG: class I SAM-dependent rRNA methyltransferase [Bacteroidota bacterium]
MKQPEFPSIQRLAIRLTAAAERHLRSGHPWIFDQSVERVKGVGRVGDLGLVFSRKKNQLLGIGLYDPHSPIRLRMIHRGKAQIDAAFFRQRLQEAMDLRKYKLNDTSQGAITGYRLLHGENDGFPGLVVDVYNQVLVVKVYSAVWGPWLADILTALQVFFPESAIVMRLSRQLQNADNWPVQWADGSVVRGVLASAEVIFQEYGLGFRANVIDGHKTGFFLDHRHNRRRVGELAKGRRVLDVFSYVGGFSVHALAGGASEVVSLDISAQAQAEAARNVALNELNSEQHEAMAGDAFKLMGQMLKAGRRFDLVIVDPPSFAKRERERAGALEAYQRLAGLAIPLVADGGIYLAASCSGRIQSAAFFSVQEKALRRSQRDWRELERTFHDFDHPISFAEGAYLKSVYYQLQ